MGESAKYPIGAKVFRRATGELLGRLTGWYAQGEGWPDCLLYSSGFSQAIGINADLAIVEASAA